MGNRLLYIESSPMGERSTSSTVASAFIAACKAKDPELEITELNLFSEQLPEFDREASDQKYQQITGLLTGKGKPAPTDQWSKILGYIEQLKAADKVVVSAPMWNFSIPYKLKHYIDLICQPGESFSFDPKTLDYIGLIKDKPLQLVLSSSSEYPDPFPKIDGGTKQDYQRSYLNHVFKFIGFEDIRTIKIEPTTAMPAELQNLIENKKQEAQEAAQLF